MDFIHANMLNEVHIPNHTSDDLDVQFPACDSTEPSQRACCDKKTQEILELKDQVRKLESKVATYEIKQQLKSVNNVGSFNSTVDLRSEDSCHLGNESQVNEIRAVWLQKQEEEIRSLHGRLEECKKRNAELVTQLNKREQENKELRQLCEDNDIELECNLSLVGVYNESAKSRHKRRRQRLQQLGIYDGDV